MATPLKILVTGGAGFIGSHVVDTYITAGHDVVVVDNLSTGRRANLNPAATFYEVDIRDADLADVFAQEQPEVVNHHAAQASVPLSVSRPTFDAEVNILGSLNLLEQARHHGVQRLIYASTGGAVYGEPQYLPCDESHPIRPLSPYGASKHTVEHYLQLYHQLYGLGYTVLRYANVYGPRQDPHGEAGVVSIFTNQMLAGEPAIVHGDGLQERDFIYAGDCARANLAALEQDRDGIFNIGTGAGTTINDLFDRLAAITGYPHPRRHGPPRLGDVYRSYLSAALAARELGWQPVFALEDGLRETVAYFQQS
ncbi:MAG: SDR family oxidoreductase [Anaerolineae bacterium]|nr:SDR family oxidoreductase [Anaerolineae bacterium]